VKFFVWGLLTMLGCTRVPTSRFTEPPTKIVEPERAPKGRWYLAASGRAVHCYGPVVKVGEMDGLPHLYATRCLPGSMTVKLHE